MRAVDVIEHEHEAGVGADVDAGHLRVRRAARSRRTRRRPGRRCRRGSSQRPVSAREQRRVVRALGARRRRPSSRQVLRQVVDGVAQQLEQRRRRRSRGRGGTARRPTTARSRASRGRSAALQNTAPVARTPDAGARAPGRGRVVRDDPARQQVGRGARAIDPDAVARRLVQRHERIEQRRRRLAVRRLQRVARAAAGQPDAHEAIVVVLADRPRDLQVARLLEAAPPPAPARPAPARPTSSRRRSARRSRRRRTARAACGAPTASPARPPRGAPLPAQCSLGAPRAQLGPALEQRELLDQERQRLGGAPHEVPAARLLVGEAAAAPGASRPGRAGSGAVKPSSYQVLPSEMPWKKPDGAWPPSSAKAIGRQRALARRLAAGGDQRQRRRQPAAPARLPGRVRAVARSPTASVPGFSSQRPFTRASCAANAAENGRSWTSAVGPGQLLAQREAAARTAPGRRRSRRRGRATGISSPSGRRAADRSALGARLRIVRSVATMRAARSALSRPDRRRRRWRAHDDAQARRRHVDRQRGRRQIGRVDGSAPTDPAPALRRGMSGTIGGTWGPMSAGSLSSGG